MTTLEEGRCLSSEGRDLWGLFLFRPLWQFTATALPVRAALGYRGWQETRSLSLGPSPKGKLLQEAQARPFLLRRTMPEAALPLPAGNAWEKRGGPLPRSRASGSW